jgi:hypothetical protein
MNDLIQSLPSPHLQRGNYSHMDGGVMDGQWSDIGDGGNEDLLQIPVPVGCQNRVSGSESRFLMAAAQQKSIWENAVSPILSRQRVYVGQRGGRDDGWGLLTPGWRGQGWAAPPVCEGPSGLLSLWSSGSMGLLVK